MIIYVMLAAIPVIGALTFMPGWLRRRRSTADESFAEYRDMTQPDQGDPLEAARDFIDYSNDHGLR